ncbi:hypothetical protein WG936_08315 [Corynebacterium sp. H127]|uniref:hypothetical protein n=1 Tax=Corynebacterium sp. H127 TaxID=3133418 RepID=UPI00309F7D1A
MRKLITALATLTASIAIITPAQAGPFEMLRLLDTNYLATTDCGSLQVTLQNMNLVTGPTTKSELGARVKTSGSNVLAGLNYKNEDATLILNKAAMDISNRALECGIVQEDPKIMGSIEMPKEVQDLQILLSN